MYNQKQVGAPCNVCGQPYVMGSKGAYCVNCYKTWKQNNGGSQPNSQASYQAPNSYVKPNSQPSRDYEKEAFGKCKHAFLVEAFKLGMTVEEAEPVAERWAKASVSTTSVGAQGNTQARPQARPVYAQPAQPPVPQYEEPEINVEEIPF
jgi:hypothetical protein